MTAQANPIAGCLYVVGTPLGNLEDMTFRAVRILQSVDLIAAEDTRHTAKLLQHFQITTPQISYHTHNRQQRHEELLHHLQVQQHSIALVSDAGMPGISDPGYELIAACIEAGVAVIPIPGPTAAITALCVSGLPTDHFVFEGFLPLKDSSRKERLTLLQQEQRTIILYEAPHRLLKTLGDLSASLSPDRKIALGRELTKRFEEYWYGTLESALTHYEENPPKGEFTLVIQGCEPVGPVLSEDALKAELQSLMSSGLSRSEASRHLAKATGKPKKEIYQLSLAMKSEE
jgi:16S rRNA (cytidine1402-2'-O)-methyltransferase